MEIFDAQIHLWMPNTPENPFAPGRSATYQGEKYLIDDALALFDRNGVSGGVVVTPSWMGNDNSYGLEAARRHPGRFAVMGRFDYGAAEADVRLARWRETPGMLGIRATLVDPLTLSMFEAPENFWFWESCAQLGLPLMCYAPQVIHLLAPVAERAPGLRLIVDHAGRFAQGPRDDAAWEDIGQLLDLARFDNVAVKVSSLPSFTSQPYPFENLHPHIRAIYNAFGADRLIWGSDVTRLDWSYEDNIRLFAEALDFLSAADREKIFSRNLTCWCDADFGGAA